MFRVNNRLILAAIVLVAAFTILYNAESQTRAEDGPDPYPAPPTAGPTSQPVYVSETASEVAEAILDEWIEDGAATSDTEVESATEITSADAACFSMDGDLIAAGDSTDVAAVYSGDSITTSILVRASKENVLVIIEKTFGREYAVFSAPTLAPLLDMLTCADHQ